MSRYTHIDLVSVYTDTTATKPSLLLKSASISRNGSSAIVVDCEFSETYPQASCVLVYREYDSPLLTVVELFPFNSFPVSITVDTLENYTFALFGKGEEVGMEEEPMIYMKFSTNINQKTPPGSIFSLP